MDRQLKQRVVGAAVLVVLGVIFIPIFLDNDALETRIPEVAELPPAPEAPYESHVEPIDEDDMFALERAMEEPVAPPLEPMPGPIPGSIAGPAHEDAGSAAAPAGQEDAAVAQSAHADPAGSAASAAEPVAATAGAGAAAEDPVAGAGWSVQLGSFAEQDNASRLVARLQEAQLPGYVERSSENGASIWKVRVGPVIAREEAEKLRARLARDFGLEGLLLRYP